MNATSKLEIFDNKDSIELKFKGSFDVFNIGTIEKQLSNLKLSNRFKGVVIDFKGVKSIDTAFALIISDFKKKIVSKGLSFQINSDDKTFIDVVELTYTNSHSQNISEPKKISYLENLGKQTIKKVLFLREISLFIGTVFVHMFFYLKSYKNLRIKEILFEVHESIFKAIGIIALTSFLIGVVVAYQSAVQLKQYGANIFIVDMLGLSLFRELAPMITAIIVAGRSGSAYAAQMGVMKITQELDAMRTMGFDPYAFLVLPRIITLMLMLSVLIFVSDIMSLVGGMLIAKIELGIEYSLFIERLREAVDVRHFLVGILKAPFFGFAIAAIGLYQGLQVKNDTQSIGINTTRSVVQSIFIVIIIDAIFSILFTSLGI